MNASAAATLVSTGGMVATPEAADGKQNGGGPAIAFGPFLFLAGERVLLRAGKQVRLGSRAREILAALVERAGKIVKKRELMAHVWPDSFVEEGTLHIAALRKALGDGQGGTRYAGPIRTTTRWWRRS